MIENFLTQTNRRAGWERWLARGVLREIVQGYVRHLHVLHVEDFLSDLGQEDCRWVVRALEGEAWGRRPCGGSGEGPVTAPVTGLVTAPAAEATAPCPHGREQGC